MRDVTISKPELALIAGTRMLLGAGIGMLAAGCLSEDQRKAMGWTLFAVGAATTIPLATQVLMHGTSNRKPRKSAERFATAVP